MFHDKRELQRFTHEVTSRSWYSIAEQELMRGGQINKTGSIGRVTEAIHQQRRRRKPYVLYLHLF